MICPPCCTAGDWNYQGIYDKATEEHKLCSSRDCTCQHWTGLVQGGLGT